MRVLAVDDEPDVRMLLEVALGLEPDIDLTLCASGADALAAAAHENYDVILLDGLMPGMSGAETCQRLRAAPATAGVPILFLTAMTTNDARTELLAAGATGFITKPFEPFGLAAELRRLLSGVSVANSEAAHAV